MANGRTWTSQEIAFVSDHHLTMDRATLAAHLQRTRASVMSFCKTHGFTRDRHYKDDQKAFVTAHPDWTAKAIAAQLGKSETSIHQLRQRLGMSEKRKPFDAAFQQLARDKYALGWSDAEIASVTGHDRHAIGGWRKRLGLANNALSEHRRRRVAEVTRRQLARKGFASLAMERVSAFKRYARQYGWPEDLRPRQVRMLNAMLRHGPMTRRQLAEAIDMPWKGTHKSLVGNVPGGSYLADLMRRGLVVSLGRVVKGKGSGHSTFLYSIPLWTERNRDGQQAAQVG